MQARVSQSIFALRTPPAFLSHPPDTFRGMSIETVIDMLNDAGLEVEFVYDGPLTGCPACSRKELTAAA